MFYLSKGSRILIVLIPKMSYSGINQTDESYFLINKISAYHQLVMVLGVLIEKVER